MVLKPLVDCFSTSDLGSSYRPISILSLIRRILSKIRITASTKRIMGRLSFRLYALNGGKPASD
jgi:hypothetical protein